MRVFVISFCILFLGCSCHRKTDEGNLISMTQKLQTAQSVSSSTQTLEPASAKPITKPERYNLNPNKGGIYGIWTGDKEYLYDLPFVKGGQLVFQWADFEKKRGEYDFSALEKELKRMHELDRYVTVQLNGNIKSSYLFNIVPYYPKKLSVQVSNLQGTLMYWHPSYLKAYLDVLDAFGKYLNESPYRKQILGIRMNFNPYGTEHFDPTIPGIPNVNKTLDGWVRPEGEEDGTVPYTDAAKKQYMKAVMDKFRELFEGKINVFVRHQLFYELDEEERSLFENGVFSWFLTHMNVEAPGKGASYVPFITYCRTGKTLGYGESIADAFGYRAAAPNGVPGQNGVQWNYWRILCDLNAGVSYIGVYGNDLQIAASGTHPKKKSEVQNLQGAFLEAFEFGAKYAGFHCYPDISPGAFIVFRSSIISKGQTIYEETPSLLRDDYTFLMKKVSDDTSVVTNIGPADVPYGLWARKAEAGNCISLKIDGEFITSAAKPLIRVIYYEDAEGSFEIHAGAQKIEIKTQKSNSWKTIDFQLTEELDPDSPIHIDLLCTEGTVYFHRVEALR